MAKVHVFEAQEVIEREASMWLIRLDGDEPLTREEELELRAWAARSPAHKAELQRISDFWQSNNVLTELSIPLQAMAQREQRADQAGFVERFWNRGAAWSMAVCVALALLVFREGWLPMAPEDSNGMYVTAIGAQRSETLADGSVLQMNTDTQVQVQFSAGVRKIRLLRGEAHFDVAHEADWPFEVYAGGGRVQALGTAFSVRLHETNKRLNVIVTDGQVSLAVGVREPLDAPSHEAGPPLVQGALAVPAGQSSRLEKFALLSKGEGMRFQTSTAERDPQALSSQEINRQLAWREGYLEFAGEPLSVVVDELNRYQVISVEIVDPALSELPIGGRFKVGELDALFDALDNHFAIQVSRIDDQHIQLLPKAKTQ